MTYLKKFESKLFKSFLLLFFFLIPVLAQSDTTGIYFASWNLENLFDTIDDPEKNDADFLPAGRKEWTEERLSKKIENLSRVINFLNSSSAPDIIAVQEVEHESLLLKLINEGRFNKNYKTAYAESPDKRGIDCGLIYNSDLFELENVEAHKVILPDEYPTRDIVQVNLLLGKRHISVFVNHWPSRRGGLEKSAPNRIAAAETLLEAYKSLIAEIPEVDAIIAGDFNDEPENKSMLLLEEAGLINLSSELYEKGIGSYRYKEDWNMLDQIIVNKAMLSGNLQVIKSSFNVIKPEFAITKKGYFKGTIIPTFGGRKYLGGYSDHYPVGVKILKID